MRALITGSGNMGRAIASGLEARGDEVTAMAGREAGYPDPTEIGPVDVTFEFSHDSTLLEHVDLGLDAGCRAFVVGTTGWRADDEMGQAFARRLTEHGARAVVAPTFSLGAVLFGDVAEYAARLFGAFAEYDAYLFEQHRAAKADRRVRGLHPAGRHRRLRRAAAGTRDASGGARCAVLSLVTDERPTASTAHGSAHLRHGSV